jgi:hypothetical protein
MTTSKNGTTTIEYDTTAAQKSRADRFKSTGEPSEYPRVAGDEAVAERAAAHDACPTGGKVVRSGAFDSLEQAANAKK